MSYIRKLPSGKWQATVRGPDGRRHTFTDPLKTTARRWAAEQEALLARGDFRDPHLGEIRVGGMAVAGEPRAGHRSGHQGQARDAVADAL